MKAGQVTGVRSPVDHPKFHPLYVAAPTFAPPAVRSKGSLRSPPVQRESGENVGNLSRRRTAIETELGLDLALDMKRSDRLIGARRGIRWFLRAHDWDNLEERIGEVLRSYDPLWEMARPGVAQLLDGARLKGRTGLAILELPRDKRREATTGLWDALDSDDFLRFQIGGDLTFYVDHDALPKIRESLDVEMATTGPLAEIEVILNHGNDDSRQDAARLVLDLLDHAGVQVHSDHWSVGAAVVLIPQHQAFLAAGVLDGAPARLDSLLPDGVRSS